jgi:hypothetical protein
VIFRDSIFKVPQGRKRVAQHEVLGKKNDERVPEGRLRVVHHNVLGKRGG